MVGLKQDIIKLWKSLARSAVDDKNVYGFMGDKSIECYYRHNQHHWLRDPQMTNCWKLEKYSEEVLLYTYPIIIFFSGICFCPLSETRHCRGLVLIWANLAVLPLRDEMQEGYQTPPALMETQRFLNTRSKLQIIFRFCLRYVQTLFIWMVDQVSPLGDKKRCWPGTSMY